MKYAAISQKANVEKHNGYQKCEEAERHSNNQISMFILVYGIHFIAAETTSPNEQPEQ